MQVGRRRDFFLEEMFRMWISFTEESLKKAKPINQNKVLE
jgi:hypothetical protein